MDRYQEAGPGKRGVEKVCKWPMTCTRVRKAMIMVVMIMIMMMTVALSFSTTFKFP